MPRASLALCLALLIPLPAAAQPIDQAGADALRHDLQSWFAGVWGPNPAAGTQRLRVTPEGDHFQVLLPFGEAGTATAISADVRPQQDGHWSVDALRLPAEAHFTLQIPQPGGPPHTRIPAQFDLRIGGQHATASIDPTLTAPSQLAVDLANVQLDTDSAQQHRVQHIDRYAVQVTMQPNQGRLDLVQHTSIAGWRSAARVGDKPATGFGADRIQGIFRVDGIDPAHATAMISATSGFLATLPPAAAEQHGELSLSPPQRAALRALIESLRGIVTGVRGQETLDGVHFAVAGIGETAIQHMSLEMSGAAPNGMLHATLTLGLDGLMAGAVPPAMRGLVPHHVMLQPSVSGVSLAALTTLALAATDQNPDHARLQADTAALWAQGGVTVGLDAVDMDLGPAALHGRGSVRVIGPGNYEGHLHISATGVDLLMQQAAGDPALQRALPLLAMARGFARQEGDHLVWDIVTSPAGTMVNDVPLGGQHHPDNR